jgi:chromosome segregation ATPase
MPTTTRKTKASVSSELRQVEAERERLHAKVREAREDVTAYDAETERLRAELTERIHAFGSEFEGAQRLPIQGTQSAKLAAKIKKRMREPTPCQGQYEAAMAAFTAADLDLSRLKKERLHDRLAEVRPDNQRAADKIREGLDLLREGCAEFQVGVNEVGRIVADTPGLHRRSGMYHHDPRPEEWYRMADAALESEIILPYLTEEAEWRLSNGG